MEIRGIRKADYDFIVSVLDRWWGGPSGIPAHPIFFYEFGSRALVATEGDEVVGFLFGFTTDQPEPTGYIHMVGIHPQKRRAGIGKALYDAFMSQSRAAGLSRIKTIAFVGDDGPIAFHRAMGFDVHEDPEYAGPGRARVVFTMQLAPDVR